MKYTTALIVAYYVLTMLFPSNNPLVETQRIYPQVCMAIICIYLLCDAIKNRALISESKIMRAFIPLVTIGFIYILYPMYNQNGQNVLFSNGITFLKDFMGIPFMFYIYTQMQKDEENCIRNIKIIFAFQLIYAFYSLWYDRQLFLLKAVAEGFDSNSGFILVCCIPMTLLIKQSKLKMYLYITLCLACIYCGQRSAALAALVTIPLCFKKLISSKKPIDAIVFLLCFILFGLPVLLESINNLIIRNQVDAANNQIGSGRGEFWMYVWNGIWNSPLHEIIFGHGSSTVQLLLEKKYGLHILSHNGWLDYLYMYGLIGFFIYFKSIITLFIEQRLFFDKHSKYKKCLTILFVIFLVKCSTSHGNWDVFTLPMAMCLGIIAHKFKTHTEYDFDEN